jgi:hypothetical protein
MTFTEQQIEWIVVEVLRRLGVAGGENTSGPAAMAGELRLTESVVTMRSIEGRLTGVARVVVPRRAVVTPAAKDELRQRSIELIHEGKA